MKIRFISLLTYVFITTIILTLTKPAFAQVTTDVNSDYATTVTDVHVAITDYGSQGLTKFLATDIHSDGKINSLDFGNIFSNQSPVTHNWWPMQLGNYWVYEVTEFDADQFSLWEQNFSGARTGVGTRNCAGDFGLYKQQTLGTKTAATVNPSMGYNRFFTTRFVQFYKESQAAYHAPQYCDMILGPSATSNWNLQWYTHAPQYHQGQYWYGSEGGVRFYRSALNGHLGNVDPQLLEQNAEISSFGFFPKNQGLHYGGGRYPAYNGVWTGLLGYTYIPLNRILDNPNTTQEIVPDVSYEFGGGTLSDINDFRTGISSYLNDVLSNRLIWNLEYIPLKAADVLTKDVIPPATDILSIIFFEPLYRDLNQTSLPQGEEIACENFYLAKDIGLVKATHSIVAVLPNDPNLEKTRQLCFWIYRSDFEKSTDSTKHGTDFGILNPYLTDIQNFKYSYPKNSFEITAYKLYTNLSADVLGFHSPTAASLVDFPEINSIEYYANGKFWVYKPDGSLWAEGNLLSAWQNHNITPVQVNQNSVYPWTDNGPDAVDSGSDSLSLFGAKSLVINNGAYWLRNPGTATPFGAGSGLVRNLFPEYGQQFGDDTDDLGMTGVGNNQLLLVKNGVYFYYEKNTQGQLILFQSGKLNANASWLTAPLVSGRLPWKPDNLMYGPIFNETYNVSATKNQNPILSPEQLIVFQKGAAWVRYGINGPWEDWGPDTIVAPNPLPTASPVPNPTASPSPSPLNQVLTFDQTPTDAANSTGPRQTVISDDGTQLFIRTHDGSTWGTWLHFATSNLGISGVTTARSFDQVVAPNGLPKQTVISMDGTTQYIRTFTNNTWSSWSSGQISGIGISGVSSIAAFDQIVGDTSTQNRPKQTVVSFDGTQFYTRFYENDAWNSWSSAPVSVMGISGVTQIRSFNQSLTPNGEPKQDVLSWDGHTLYSRTYTTSWQPWTSLTLDYLTIYP